MVHAPPFQPRTEAALAFAARAGGPDAPAALDELARAVEKLVRQRAHAVARRNAALSADDLISVGMQAVMEAARYYDPARGRWTTYAGTAAARAIHKRATRDEARAERLPCQPWDAETEDLAAAPEVDPLSACAAAEALAPLLATLDPLALEFVRAVHGIGGPQLEWRRAALMYGLAPRGARDLLARSLALLAATAKRPA